MFKRTCDHYCMTITVEVLFSPPILLSSCPLTLPLPVPVLLSLSPCSVSSLPVSLSVTVSRCPVLLPVSCPLYRPFPLSVSPAVLLSVLLSCALSRPHAVPP